MQLKKISNLNHKYLNYLVFLFPLSFVFGNLFINLEIVLISILGLFLYKKDIFDLKNNLTLKILILFFVAIILSTLINLNENFLKSILFSRYLIFAMVLSCAVKKNHINFKTLFLSCLILTAIISFDVVFQYIVGKNILGFPSSTFHNSSIFGNELISGGYIQKFGIMGIFFAAIFFLKEKNIKSSTGFVLISSLIISGVMLSGNRMSLLLMLVFLVLAIILIKELRYHLIATLLIISSVFYTVLNTNENYKMHYGSFYGNGLAVFGYVKDELLRGPYPELEEKIKMFDVEKDRKEFEKKFYSLKYRGEFLGENYELIPFGSGHSIIFITAIDTWLDKPIIGNGIKSFRITCLHKSHLPNRTCQSHPHNYYLDLLNDGGLIGTFLMMVVIIYLTIKKFWDHVRLKIRYTDNLIFYGIYLTFFLEMFPIRSSGSFFSTYSAAFIFFLIGLFLNINLILKKINS